MKKVALFMDGWKRYFTYAWPLGFMQKIKDANADVNLYIFNSNGNWNKDDDYSYGEYNIYNLPDLTDFDGIIISVNNIKYPEVVSNLLDRIRRSGVPAVSLETSFDGLHFVGIDNYDAMYDITRHLIKKHNAKRIWYLAGPEDNYEAQERCRAFRDCMDEYGVDLGEQDILYSGFGFNDGISGFEKLLINHGCIDTQHVDKAGKGGGPAEVYGEITSGTFADSASGSNADDSLQKKLAGILPDAVICANDNLAVGVCNRAESLGLSVPDDFKVTGFDNFDKAANYTPRITTVGRIREKIGYMAAEILLDAWAGKDPAPTTYIDYECIFSESCGCEVQASIDGRQYLKNYILGVVEREEIDENTLDFTHLLGKCEKYEELYPCIQQAFAQATCKRSMVVIDRALVEMGQLGPAVSAAYDEDIFNVHGYPKKMRLVYSQGLEKKSGDVYQRMFPLLNDETGGNIYLFAPFHFGDRAVGFCCVENGYYLMDKQLWSTVMSEMNMIMVNLFNKWRLEQINQELTAISIKDPLTQIYNREGMKQIATKAFENAAEYGHSLMVIFVDMDRLKYINDTFGHEYGDKAIKSIARAVAGGGGVNSIPVRYGGDEFLSISLYNPDDSPEEKKAAILQKAKEIEKHENLPFELECSMGYVITNPDGEEGLDEYIRMADHIMYQEKMRKKANR